MDDKVIKLVSSAMIVKGPKPDKEIIGTLEDLLERAKVGAIQGLAYAYVHDDGERSTGWTTTDDDVSRLAHAIMVLNHRFGRASD